MTKEILNFAEVTRENYIHTVFFEKIRISLVI